MEKLAFHRCFVCVCGGYEIRTCGRFNAIVKVTSNTRIVVRLVDKTHLSSVTIKNTDNKIDKFSYKWRRKLHTCEKRFKSIYKQFKCLQLNMQILSEF